MTHGLAFADGVIGALAGPPEQPEAAQQVDQDNGDDPAIHPALCKVGTYHRLFSVPLSCCREFVSCASSAKGRLAASSKRFFWRPLKAHQHTPMKAANASTVAMP